MSADRIFFIALAVGSVATALLMVTRRNPVVSVLYLIANFFFLAVLYLSLQAQFIAIIQILVYAGAIMVLFLFVIMLLNLGGEQQLADKLDRRKAMAIGLGVVMLVQLIMPLLALGPDPQARISLRAEELGTVEFMGKALFTQYVFPFEVVSLLLLAAILGAVVLAKKRFR